MRFLIDECLSPSLARTAVEAGFAESAHVVHRGMGGWPDHRLMRAILDDDWTLVTRNADDFRPRADSASKAPCYADVPLHAGLVCLNLPEGTGRAEQQAYFRAALEAVGNPGELVNEILEVDPNPEDPDRPLIRRYDFPAPA